MGLRGSRWSSSFSSTPHDCLTAAGQGSSAALCPPPANGNKNGERVLSYEEPRDPLRSSEICHYAKSSAKCSSHHLGHNIGISLMIVFILGSLPVLIVRGLLLVIRGFPPRREFPHPQPGGRAGWPEEGTPGRLGCMTEGHSEGGSLVGGSRSEDLVTPITC